MLLWRLFFWLWVSRAVLPSVREQGERFGGPVRRSLHEGSGETRLPGGVRGWPRAPSSEGAVVRYSLGSRR